MVGRSEQVKERILVLARAQNKATRTIFAVLICANLEDLHQNYEKAARLLWWPKKRFTAAGLLRSSNG
jgi:hypothetical protein